MGSEYDDYKDSLYEKPPLDKSQLGYYRTIFYLGYRPLIGWLIAIAIGLLFPVQLLLILLASVGIVTIDLLTYKPLVDAISVPLVSLAGTIIGFRTYEKVKGL
jgi:uncharacterized membrane protein (Fun14 family)